MNTDINANDYAAFIAIDWADQKHVFSLLVPGQAKKETGTLTQTPEAIGQWVAGLRERFASRPVAVAIELARGALIHALLEYEFLVLYPIHPTTVAKFRQAFKSSGSKNDPLDADQILEILTKHRDRLTALRPDTEETRLLGRLVADRRRAVDLRTGHVQALLACLKEYYPQAIALLHDNLSSRLAGDFLRKWPTLAAVQQARPATLKKFYYGHNLRSPKLIEQALALVATAQPLTRDPAVIESGRRLALLYVQLIQALNPAIAEYEARIATVFAAHPEAKLFTGIPGAGAALAPRLLACFGTNRSRYEKAEDLQSLSGIAPVTKSSGKASLVYFRQACPKFVRQTFHEFARLSVADCQWARNYVTYYVGQGKPYHAVIRALAFKWIRVLFRCWQDRAPYDESKHLASLKQRGSIFVTCQLSTSPEK